MPGGVDPSEPWPGCPCGSLEPPRAPLWNLEAVGTLLQVSPTRGPLVSSPAILSLRKGHVATGPPQRQSANGRHHAEDGSEQEHFPFSEWFSDPDSVPCPGDSPAPPSPGYSVSKDMDPTKVSGGEELDLGPRVLGAESLLLSSHGKEKDSLFLGRGRLAGSLLQGSEDSEYRWHRASGIGILG